MSLSGKVLIGVSSWADPDLARSGAFYPAADMEPVERLRYYASKFGIAEVDSTFHAMPPRWAVDLWTSATPDDFVFDVKAYSLFTGHPTPFTALPRRVRDSASPPKAPGKNVYLHHLDPGVTDDLWAIFLKALAPLRKAGKLGAVLFQFPPWFHAGEENRDYIASCRKRMGVHRMAVEFRTPDWLDGGHAEGTLGFLRDHDIALVCVDEPQGLPSSVPPLEVVTASPAIVRFHGRNRDAWGRKGATPEQKFEYSYIDAELEEWIPRIKAMSETAQSVHVVFKNKPVVASVASAKRFRELLGGRRMRRP